MYCHMNVKIKTSVVLGSATTQKVGVNENSKTIRPNTTLHFSNLKSCTFRLYEAAIIRIHFSQI